MHNLPIWIRFNLHPGSNFVVEAFKQNFVSIWTFFRGNLLIVASYNDF